MPGWGGYPIWAAITATKVSGCLQPARVLIGRVVSRQVEWPTPTLDTLKGQTVCGTVAAATGEFQSLTNRKRGDPCLCVFSDSLRSSSWLSWGSLSAAPLQSRPRSRRRATVNRRPRPRHPATGRKPPLNPPADATVEAQSPAGARAGLSLVPMLVRIGLRPAPPRSRPGPRRVVTAALPLEATGAAAAGRFRSRPRPATAVATIAPLATVPGAADDNRANATDRGRGCGCVLSSNPRCRRPAPSIGSGAGGLAGRAFTIPTVEPAIPVSVVVGFECARAPG